MVYTLRIKLCMESLNYIVLQVQSLYKLLLKEKCGLCLKLKFKSSYFEHLLLETCLSLRCKLELKNQTGHIPRRKLLLLGFAFPSWVPYADILVSSMCIGGL